MIGGGLAGLAGAFVILAPSTIAGSSTTYKPLNIIVANGFNSIAVALLGNNDPIEIKFSSFFISLIQRSGAAASLFDYKPKIIEIVIAVIIYFSAFALFIKMSFANFFNKFFKNTYTTVYMKILI